MAMELVAAGRTRTEETTGRCLTKEARENREKGNEESQDEPTKTEVTKFARCYFFACLFALRSLLWRLFILWEGLFLIFIYKFSLLSATNLLRLGPLRCKYGRNRSEWAKRCQWRGKRGNFFHDGLTRGIKRHWHNLKLYPISNK